MPGKLTITVGLPGSGKTTEASLILHNEGRDKVELVSRDDLRHLLFRSEGVLSGDQENRITKVQKQIVKDGLRAGKHVVVHDLNLREKYRNDWAQIALDYDAEFKILDLTQVPLGVCIERNVLRKSRGERHVPKDVIYSMAQKFKDTLKADQSKPYKLYPSAAWGERLNNRPVEYIPELPDAIIVDLDGTVFDCEGIRSPYDETKYHLDKPKQWVIDRVRDHAYKLGHKVIFVSGRHEDGREISEMMLNKHVKVPIEGFFMRYERGTEDSIIKLNLFNQHIRGKYNIVAVYDDRNRVVQMWRSLGLLVLQVAEGDF